MLPLYEDPHFTFRFADDRIIPRFHLEGVEAGRRVEVFKIDPGTGERLGLLATATVGEGGWVDLPEPIIVRAGEAFIAVPGQSSATPAADAARRRRAVRRLQAAARLGGSGVGDGGGRVQRHPHGRRVVGGVSSGNGSLRDAGRGRLALPAGGRGDAVHTRRGAGLAHGAGGGCGRRRLRRLDVRHRLPVRQGGRVPGGGCRLAGSRSSRSRGLLP